MRIRTDGNYTWRPDLYDDAAELLNEGTRVGGIDSSCHLVLELLGKPGTSTPGGLERVATLLQDDRIPDELALEIAEALSKGPIDVDVETRSTELSVVDE